MFKYAGAPFPYKWIFPEVICRVPVSEKVLYLTFDDGPQWEITPWVLDALEDYQAKATFFCIGRHVEKDPATYKKIVEQGHFTGNHTYSHLDGWKTDIPTYLEDTQKCQQLLHSKLFRPPYGRIGRKQYRALRQEYRIILWDCLSWDFAPDVTKEQCFENVKNHARPGSIVVFHDSAKFGEKLKYALPKTLEYFAEKGYRFEALKDDLFAG